MPVPVQTVIDDEELIVVPPVVLGLRAHVLQRGAAGAHPGLERGAHGGADAAGVVEHEVGARAEEARVVRHPLPHPRRAEVAVQRGAAVEVVVPVLRRRRPERGLVVGAGAFLERDDPLVAGGRGPRRPVVRVEDEPAASVVGVGDARERAVDDDDGVDAAVAPVREHVVRLGGAHRRRGRGGAVGLPLAAEPGLAVDVRGLGREPDDREGVGPPAVRAHLHEQRRRAAHGAELPPLGAGRRCRGGGSGGVGGREGGLVGVDGERAGERGAGGGGLRARGGEWGSEDGVVSAELPGGGEEREHGERGEEGLEVEAEQRGRRAWRNAGGGSVLPHRRVRAATARRAGRLGLGWEQRSGSVEDCELRDGGDYSELVFHWWVAD